MTILIISVPLMALAIVLAVVPIIVMSFAHRRGTVGPSRSRPRQIVSCRPGSRLR